MPKVSIIIINFNGWPDTKECLESLNKLWVSDTHSFEVVLVDNGSKELMPSFFIIPAQAGIQPQNSEPGSRNKFGMTIRQIFNQENLGFAGANNQGIKLALANNADYVLLLNNDTTVEPDFLEKLIEAGEKNKKAGILGPVIYEYKDRSKIQSAGGKVNWSRTKGEHLVVIPAQAGIQVPIEQLGNLNPGFRLKAGMTIESDYITGCCLLIRREVIEKIGLMSEDYFLYYEDTDWCLRASRAGWRSVLVPAAKIYHKASKSTIEASYPYIYYHTRNGLIFGRRFGFKPLIYVISLWIYFKQLIKLAIGYKRNWAKPVMRGVMDFWKGRMGKLEGYY